MNQLHAAENSRAGVPAGVGLHAGIDGNRHAVFLSEVYILRDIDRKRCIPVMVQSAFAAVDLDRRVHHDAVKVKENLLVLPLFRDLKIFAVARDALCIISAGRARGSILPDF